MDSGTLSRSKRPGAGFLDSGSRIGPRTSRSTIAGRFTRKTEPHQKCSTRTPLMTEPSAMPAVITPDHRPIALERWAGSVKSVRMIASVDGIRVAPPMPSTARAAISVSALSAYAATSEAAPNAAAPTRSSLRRPMRSPSEPIVISSPASTNAYMSKIHSCWVPLGSRSALICGIAK